MLRSAEGYLLIQPGADYEADIFSDIHGNIGAFQEFQKRLQQEKPDLVVFCGDVFGYYYQQDRILTALRESGWLCLLGNHDRCFLELMDGLRNVESLSQKYGSSYVRCLRTGAISEENVAFLRSLKPQVQLDMDGLNIAAFHGSPLILSTGGFTRIPLSRLRNYMRHMILLF